MQNWTADAMPEAFRVRVASKTQGWTLLAARASPEGLIAGVENPWKGKTLKSPQSAALSNSRAEPIIRLDNVNRG